MPEIVPLSQFELDFKPAFRGNFTMSINCSVNSTLCDHIKINATTCGDELMNSSNLSSIHNISDYKIGLFLKVVGLNGDTNTCKEVKPYLAISGTGLNMTEEDLKVPSTEFCVNLLPKSNSYLVLVKDRKHYSKRDCNCHVYLNGNFLKLFKCYCYCRSGSNSMSSIHLKQKSENVLQACFSNYSLSLNNTVLHIFESHRYCVHGNCFPRQVETKPYRKYNRLQRILIGELNLYF